MDEVHFRGVSGVLRNQFVTHKPKGLENRWIEFSSENNCNETYLRFNSHHKLPLRLLGAPARSICGLTWSLHGGEHDDQAALPERSSFLLASMGPTRPVKSGGNLCARHPSAV